MAIKTWVLGGGCFWCIEAVFLKVKGVVSVVSGYAGGGQEDADYQSVCSGLTAHAEVIQVTYDEGQLTGDDLLRIFFAAHDPTTMNRQGNDVGSQYRSVLFYNDDYQLEEAERVLKAVAGSGQYSAPLVTELAPLETFYPAEDYHQNYFANNPGNPYCQFAIPPKLEKVSKVFSQKMKE